MISLPARSSSPGSGSFHTANPLDSERSSPAALSDQPDWERQHRDELSSVEVITVPLLWCGVKILVGSSASVVCVITFVFMVGVTALLAAPVIMSLFLADPQSGWGSHDPTDQPPGATLTHSLS